LAFQPKRAIEKNSWGRGEPQKIIGEADPRRARPFVLAREG
jgi:hypothetical protein